jgi:hypothetical protein
MSIEIEYQTLRTELLEVSGRQLTVLAFAFSVTAALVGWGLSSNNNNSIVVLTSLIPLSFAGLQLVSHAYSIMRIATYIYYFIEPKSEHLNWESYMREFRSRISQREYPLLARFSWPAYENLLIVVGWICIGIAFILAFGGNAGSYEIYVTSGAAVLWLIFSIWLWHQMKMAVSGEMDRELEGIWASLATKVQLSDETRHKSS